MNIQSLTYKDKTIDWNLEPITFKPLTLLVGASGVGKTQILRAILNLQKISFGTSLSGLEWNIKFLTQKGLSCEWLGSFENKGPISQMELKLGLGKKNWPTIEYEKLFINEELVVDRSKNDIFFNGVKTVKLSQVESVIYLLNEEEQIKDICQEFEQILFDDYTIDFEPRLLAVREKYDVRLFEFETLESIRNSNESLQRKLYLSYENAKKTFDEIKETFIEVFPYVEDVRIALLDEFYEGASGGFSETLFIEIKEKGVHNWIGEEKISSGMFKTLMHIAELYLCADGTVILIDEFENSLGINCIDEVTRSIVSSRRNLQFIITSHHPYIINNINFKNWKLITRKAGVVKSYDATKFITGESKHQAFTQLINLDEYVEGIEE